MPLAAALALGPARIPQRLAVAGAILAILPDADVIGLRLGIAYADDWGHRGVSHSLAVAALSASLVVFWRNEWRSLFAWTFLFLSAASHGLLDMLTDGGLGVALFWPFDTARYFFPVTPITVSPIGAGFFTLRGPETLLSEIVWVWLPLAGLAILG